MRLKKTIWMKAVAILALGTFIAQSNAFALNYKSQDVLPADDFNEYALGFGLSVGLPIVAHGLDQALTITTAANETQLGSSIGKFMLNPSGLTNGQGLAGNAIIYHSATTVGQDLTKMGQLYWGMSPEASQYLGMVGSSATTFGMGGITNAQGISGIYANGSLAHYANAHPITTGILTGASFGDITGGISLATQSALKGAVSPSMASTIGSSVGSSVGAGVWGGLTHDLTGSGTTFKEGFKESVYGNSSPEAQQQGQQRLVREVVLRGTDAGISYIAESSGMEPQYANIAGSAGSMLIGNVGNLRQTTEITNNANLNKVLEPAIYAGSAYAVTKATEGADTAYNAALTNMGAFMLTSAAASGIHALTTEPAQEPRTMLTYDDDNITKGDVFKEDMAIHTFRFTKETASLSPYSMERVVSEQGPPTDYSGALQLRELWDYAGLSGFASNAGQIKQQGGDWRSVEIVKTPFHSMVNRASSMGNYYAVRNMEASSYNLIKTQFPLDPEKRYPSMVEGLSESEKAFVKTSVNASMEPPVYTPYVPAGGGNIELVEYGMIMGKDGVTAKNKFTQQQYYSDGLYKKHLQDYQKDPEMYLEDPKYSSPPQSIYDIYSSVKQPETADLQGNRLELTANIVTGYEKDVKRLENVLIPSLESMLKQQPDSLYLQNTLQDAQADLIQAQQRLGQAQDILIQAQTGEMR